MAFELVVVGTSLGGLQALQVLLKGLPKSFPVSVAIAQHRHQDSDNTLRKLLQLYSALPIIDPEDKELIMPGRVYLAPANYHLLVESDNFALSTEAPVCYARPSVDVLFESAADAYAKKVIGVILTGANQDGAQGLAKIKARGGLTVVQAPTTAESRPMPEAAIALAQGNSAQLSAGIATATVDWILSLSEIAPLVINLVNRHQ